jgi:magnesium-protoporphyrin O-methyltransferase
MVRWFAVPECPCGKEAAIIIPAPFYGAGKLFPRADRSPSIVPVSQAALARQLRLHAPMAGWQLADSRRIASGFYTSQAYRLQAPRA